MIIDELFESLAHVSAPQSAQAVYGKQILATEEQVKALVALSHVFPQRLTNAIAAIESGHCVKYECEDRHIWVVELTPVCLPYWLCSCKDFEKQLRATPAGSSQWKRACRHLLAAFILEMRYPIVDHSLVRRVAVSMSQMTDLSLDGAVRVDGECFDRKHLFN